MRYTLAIVAGLVLSLPPSADAKTLYVDRAAGSDSTSYVGNSASAPWATIGRAAWGSTSRSAPNTGEAAQPGDVVIINAGTYATAGLNDRFDPAYNPANSGAAGSPITFRANGLVTLQLSSGVGPVIGCQNRNFIVWDGFYIDEANARPRGDTGPIVVAGSNSCTIQNNEVNGIYVNYGYLDNHNGVRVENSNNTVVRGNRIYEIGVVSETGANVRGPNQSAVMLYDSNDTVIENNEFFDVGAGVYVKGQHSGSTQRRTIIRYNLIYRAEAVGLNLGPAAYQGRTYQNIVRDSGVGIKLYTLQQGSEGTQPMYEMVANNTIDNCEHGILFQGIGVQNALYNNLVTNSPYSAIYNWTDNVGTGITFNYNLYWNFRVFANYEVATDHTFASWRSTFGQDARSLNLNPMYVNQPGKDFHLQATSPARNAGLDVLDLNRNGSTSDATTMGAYVTGNETIGRGGGAVVNDASNSPPAAPTGLRITAGS